MAHGLYGIHDGNRDWAYLLREANVTGYAVISEGIGDDPTNFAGMDYSWLLPYGVTPIVRLNYSHGQGTIPHPNRYVPFSIRCANFANSSSGCRHWIVGNEPNWSIEQADGIPIMPHQYAECFRLCRHQIKQRSVTNQVIPAAIAPYNAETGWCVDYWRDMLGIIAMNGDGGAGADCLAIHTYSRGGDPNSIYSDQKMDAPYNDCHNGFRAYRDFLGAVPAAMRGLPVFITETDQIDPWLDSNSGWVKNAYDEINDWNGTVGNQTIHCLALYRWENYDQWVISGKNGVIDDFKEALWVGYTVPDTTRPDPPRPEGPRPIEPPVEPEPTPQPDRDIDPALAMRGVTFDFVSPPAGTWYWRVTKAEWLKDAANQVGPDHHILGNVLKNSIETAGVTLRVDWPSGHAAVTSKADDPNAMYNYDYGMSASLNEFSIFVDDGAPSDKVAGIGMGYGGNPAAHSSTWITFEFVQVAEPEQPQVPPHTEFVTALAGANLRAAPVDGLVLDTLPYREACTVVNETATQSDGYMWHGVNYGSHYGFIRSDLLSLVQPEPIVEPEPPSPGGDLVHPLPGSVITQHFYQDPPAYIQFNLPGHDGTDLGGRPLDTPVRCIAAGRIKATGFDAPGYGNFIEVEHEPLAASTLYAHLNNIAVREGAKVSAGHVLGGLGTTGNSTGVHLHVEVRKLNPDGSYSDLSPMRRGRVDPETWCCLHGLKL